MADRIAEESVDVHGRENQSVAYKRFGGGPWARVDAF
jgi:hypothetical protein